MSLIKRIPIDKIELGMYVSDLTPGIEDGELRTNGFIRRWETVDELSAKGLTELYIDTHKGIDSPFSLPTPQENGPPKALASLEEEHARATKVYAEARQLVTTLMNDVKTGKAININPVKDLADNISSSVLANPNALLCLAAIREKDQYLLEHSINVGILMGVFSRYLGYEDELIHQLITGALLHDIGKIRVPTQILNKPDKLDHQQWIEMKRHVVYGQEVLLRSEGVGEVALSICGMHHERLDGTGYPMALKEFNINNYGRIAAIVDVYDAITANRAYSSGKPPAEAMKLLENLAGHHLDKNLVAEFISCMSIYPIGSLVELDSGKIGVVISINRATPEKPVIRAFYNARHKHYEQPDVVDLCHSSTSIISTINPSEHKIVVSDFL